MLSIFTQARAVFYLSSDYYPQTTAVILILLDNIRFIISPHIINDFSSCQRHHWSNYPNDNFLIFHYNLWGKPLRTENIKYLSENVIFFYNSNLKTD